MATREEIMALPRHAAGAGGEMKPARWRVFRSILVGEWAAVRLEGNPIAAHFPTWAEAFRFALRGGSQ